MSAAKRDSMRSGLLAAWYDTKTTVSLFRIGKLKGADNEAAPHDSVRVLVELSAIVVACSGAM